MNVANHAAAGVLIAAVVNRPAVALPLALASHFALDALPHFGYAGHGGFGVAFKHRLTYFGIIWSFLALIFLLAVLQGGSAVLYLAGFLAVAPDFMWLYRYYGFERKGLKPPGGPITRFHQNIQWCERPWGIMVEVVFFVVAISLVINYL